MRTAKPIEAGPSNIKIGVRPETRAKFEAIAKAKRWTLVETADAIADEYMGREGIAVPSDAKTRRRATATV